MNAREERGLVIAATCKIDKKGGVFLVPSQSGSGKYTVCPDPENPHCSCPDHETRGVKCKHIFAVEFAMQQQQNADGSTTTTESVKITTKRKTYPQVWPAYNAAQTHEKERFLSLLADLCGGVPEPKQRSGKGRPPIPLSDALFACCYKVYSTVSGRRFMTDLRDAQERGYIRTALHYNSIFTYLENPSLFDVLRSLIGTASLPLKAVEVDFACDSSGFSTSRFVRWFDHKYGKVRQEHDWVKVHLMCGVKTNVVTSVEIHERNSNDSPILPGLVKATKANGFAIREVSGDKQYAGLKNYAAIDGVGAVPFIPFRPNHRGHGGGLWEKMFHYFHFRRDDFMSHYHKRSNVESTFSMIKAKFRDSVRSKTDVAMRNEVLCKVLCHNVVCLIHEMYELGIEPDFWAETSPAQ